MVEAENKVEGTTGGPVGISWGFDEPESCEGQAMPSEDEDPDVGPFVQGGERWPCLDVG